ncbi:MAG: DUF4838 domain-containing protein [Cellulosilyticaceae bacterium]
MEFYISVDCTPLCSITKTTTSSRAASILKDYLARITSASFKVTSALTPLSSIQFTESSDYGTDGFGYEVVGNKLIIKAAEEKSFVYAVYDLLERVIGCRYFTEDAEYVPTSDTLTIDVAPYHFVPSIDYREIYYKGFETTSFAEKHKAATSKTHEGWGFWCHSFGDLLPSKTYFESHPEYFALLNGERHPQGEPCLSNPEVRRIMIENLRHFMDEKPECRFWSVSQNDDNNFCTCDACKAIDDHDESQMGSVLNFVNEVASLFPDKVISTLSYWYTRKPPKHTRPASNVHIMTCNIEAARGLPIATDPQCRESKEELEFWASISDNVSLWDYNIQFRNLVSPFPNLRTLAPNMQFFVKNNVKLLFSQCNREIGGEFSELRGYLLAKLAWDPYCNINYHMEDFCKGYYGDAAPYILEYIKQIHDVAETSHPRLDIFGGPEDARNTYLTESLWNNYETLFTQAEAAVANHKDLLLRVQTAHLPIHYAGIVLKYGTVDVQNTHIINFAKTARATKLHMVEEWKITVDQFVTDALCLL